MVNGANHVCNSGFQVSSIGLGIFMRHLYHACTRITRIIYWFLWIRQISWPQKEDERNPPFENGEGTPEIIERSNNRLSNEQFPVEVIEKLMYLLTQQQCWLSLIYDFTAGPPNKYLHICVHFHPFISNIAFWTLSKVQIMNDSNKNRMPSLCI